MALRVIFFPIKYRFSFFQSLASLKLKLKEKKNMILILYTSVFASVCMLSMSFTLNIVNIHRTILHVLALHLGRGRNLVYFTRTSQKREKRGEEKRWWRRVRLDTELCLRLVESSVLVAFFFEIHISYEGFR